MNDEILNLILSCIEKQNIGMNKDDLLPLNESTVLCGLQSSLDSLGLATLLLSIEVEFNKCYNKEICLIDSVCSKQLSKVFNTVNSLCLHLKSLL